jgi:hypothetical protein
MLTKIQKWLDRFGTHITVWQFIQASGILSAALATGFVAKATDWIAAWGPIGWWSAAVLGALCASFLLLLIAKVRDVRSDTYFKSKIYERTEQVNPIEQVFEKRRLKLGDLLPPLGLTIKGKTFIDCELIGPANVIILGHTSIRHCGGQSVQAAIVKEGWITNSIGLEDCIVQRCNLYQITFLVPEPAFEVVSKGMNGLVWITPTPGGEFYHRIKSNS